MFRNILLATDFSDVSEGALQYARELARRFDARLHLVHVLEEPLVPAMWAESYVAELPGLRARMQEDAQERLKNLLSPAEHDLLQARIVTRFGPPYQSICEYASVEQIDLIVLGTHGRGALAHIIMGSVAERVVRHAPCPVLTVRPRPAPAKAVAREALGAELPNPGA